MIIRRLNLFPIIFEFRKYGIRWSRIGYCCGLSFYKPKRLLILHFALRDKYYYRCPQCGKLHCITMSWHTETYYDKDIREQNRLLGDKVG